MSGEEQREGASVISGNPQNHRFYSPWLDSECSTWNIQLAGELYAWVAMPLPALARTA
jgi:hypothetical protein